MTRCELCGRFHEQRCATRLREDAPPPECGPLWRWTSREMKHGNAYAHFTEQLHDALMRIVRFLMCELDVAHKMPAKSYVQRQEQLRSGELTIENCASRQELRLRRKQAAQEVRTFERLNALAFPMLAPRTSSARCARWNKGEGKVYDLPLETFGLNPASVRHRIAMVERGFTHLAPRLYFRDLDRFVSIIEMLPHGTPGDVRVCFELLRRAAHDMRQRRPVRQVRGAWLRYLRTLSPLLSLEFRTAYDAHNFDEADAIAHRVLRAHHVRFGCADCDCGASRVVITEPQLTALESAYSATTLTPTAHEQISGLPPHLRM